MHRFFARWEGAQGAIAHIDAQEAAHLGKVLRLAPGDTVQLLDGRGNRCLAQLTQADKTGAQARVLEMLPGNEARVQVTLYQGMPKSDKMEWIVQKCTELGAYAVRGVYFKRSDVRPDTDKQDKKIQRLERIALEAAKQCGRGAPARVLAPVAFSGCDFSGHSAVLVPWEEGGMPFSQAVRSADLSNAALVIGPEGGIDKTEIDALLAAGAVPVTLGPRILRTETAAVGALAALMCLAGEWEA